MIRTFSGEAFAQKGFPGICNVIVSLLLICIYTYYKLQICTRLRKRRLQINPSDFVTLFLMESKLLIPCVSLLTRSKLLLEKEAEKILDTPLATPIEHPRKVRQPESIELPKLPQ